MDVAVIGAGVFGAWTALLLSRAGHDVTLIDRFGPTNEQSSSAGESRIVRSAYGPDEIYTAMARRSLQLWKSFFIEEDCPDCFRNTGVLWMAPQEEPTIWQARAVFERLQIPYEWMAGEQIATRYPQFGSQGETVALFEPEAGASGGKVRTGGDGRRDPRGNPIREREYQTTSIGFPSFATD